MKSNMPMDNNSVEEFFSNIMKNEQEVSAGIAAIRTLLKFLEHDESETVQELVYKLKTAIKVMTDTDFPTTAVTSGSELFLRFITLASLDKEPFAECKKIMLHRGKVFLKKLKEARGRVAKLASGFITDGSDHRALLQPKKERKNGKLSRNNALLNVPATSTSLLHLRILTHSKSRVVLQTMKEAAQSNRRFDVYVTKSSPDSSGEEMARELNAAGILCTVILDSAVGYVMEQVDMVMVGAEGVVESGGVINKVGSFTMAVCAKEMKKPFYVLTESFKFTRLYPLNQRDLPDEFKYVSSILKQDLSKEHPLVDYTPPAYITLLFTDLGILTPSAISDELIKLYL